MSRLSMLVEERPHRALKKLANFRKAINQNNVEHAHGGTLGSSYSRLLKECTKSKAVSLGKRIHAQIVEDGLEGNRYFGNLLVSMYGKCGYIEDARKVFDKMPERNVVSWTAMIASYNELGNVKEALHLYQLMQQAGIRPNKITFLSILSGCSRHSDLLDGRRVHKSIIESGFESDTVITTSLMSMYSRCGSTKDAKELFDKMQKKDVISWNAMMAAYTRIGNGKAAVDTFHQMQREGVKGSKLTFVTVLKACGLVTSLSDGRLIHSQIMQCMPRDDLILNNALLSMYSKCGSVTDAWKIFNNMKDRDKISWNTMIAAYAQNGSASEILEFVRSMEHEGMQPDVVTWLSILGACRGSNFLATGQAVHGLIIEAGHHCNVSVANAIMSMYARCGSLEQLKDVFDSMTSRDLISWNILIQAVAQCGYDEEVWKHFEQMQQDGIIPNEATFLSCLNMCTSPMKLAKGRQLHALIIACGLKTDTRLGAALISMYGWCGSIEDSTGVFEKLPEHDVVPWTAMIGACAQNGCGKSALRYFNQMVRNGIEPNKLTFVSILNACDNPESLADGRKVHSIIAKHGLDSDNHVGTALVKMYASCGSLEDATKVFCNLIEKDVIAWNTMISVSVQYGSNDLALRLFTQMQKNDVKPNTSTFVSTLKACSGLGILEIGESIHACTVKYGLQSDQLVQNSLIEMYSKCKNLVKAHQVFDSILCKDVVSWNTLIAAYAEHGYHNAALCLYNKMEQGCIIPDIYTLVIALDICAALGLLSEGRLIHARIVSNEFDRDIVVGNALINMYGRCGNAEDAWLAFLKMLERNIVSCNIMIATFARHGFGRFALQVFGFMQWDGILPDEITFTNVLSACSHAGFIDEGSHYFVLERCTSIGTLQVSNGSSCMGQPI